MLNFNRMTLLFKAGFVLSLSLLATIGYAKKGQHFTMEKVIDLTAEKVWSIVGVDYGSVAYSHPKIISSEYIKGSLKACEGAERVCNFNEKGTQYLKEKITALSLIHI